MVKTIPIYILLIQFMVLARRTADQQTLSGLYIPMDRFCRLFSRGYGVYGKLRPCIGISSYKYVWLSRLVCLLIRHRGLVTPHSYPRAVQHGSPLDGLSDRHQYIVAFHDDRICFIILWMKSVLFIEYAGTPLEFDSLYLAVFRQDPLRSPSVIQGDSLFFCLLLLFFLRGHLFFTFQAVEPHLAASSTDGGARHVDGYIPSAYDDGPAFQFQSLM